MRTSYSFGYDCLAPSPPATCAQGPPCTSSAVAFLRRLSLPPGLAPLSSPGVSTAGTCPVHPRWRMRERVAKCPLGGCRPVLTILWLLQVVHEAILGFGEQKLRFQLSSWFLFFLRKKSAVRQATGMSGVEARCVSSALVQQDSHKGAPVCPGLCWTRMNAGT